MIKTLNGKNMTSKQTAHEYIKGKLKLREYYGENLDALWDVLSTYDRPIEIRIVNTKDLIEGLGDYGESIIEVFRDSERENKNIKFEIS